VTSLRGTATSGTPTPLQIRVSDLFLGTMTIGEPGGSGTSIEEGQRLPDRYEEACGNVIRKPVN
jgi:hypothetical protein